MAKKSHFSIAWPQLREDVKRGPQNFGKVPFIKFGPGNRESIWRHSQGVKLGISNIANYNNSLIGLRDTKSFNGRPDIIEEK